MILLFLLLLLGQSPQPAVEKADVGVYRSEASLKFAGWIGEWELNSAVHVLKSMGLNVREIRDVDFVAGDSNFSVLVLPGNRCMAASEVAAVREFKQNGGRILAFYLASYRDENNEKVGEGNHFQLADLFGCDVYRWVNAQGACEWLDDVQLGRNTAMLVTPLEGSTALARWKNADGSAPPEPVAVVQNADGSCIYVGENLLIADNGRSHEVRAYVAGLLRKLGVTVPEVKTAGYEADFSVPYPTDAPQPPAGGARMRVGLEVSPSLWLSSPNGLVMRSGPWSLELDKGEVVEVRSVKAPLTSPALTFHDAQGKLITRLSRPVKVVSADYLVQIAMRPNGTGLTRGWRGELELVPTAQGVRPINIVSIESYLGGVVPNEMPPWYGQVPLEAMSIVARTFALSQRGRHKAERFDVCSTVHCQAYQGMLSEWPVANGAVVETRGLVARWKGKLAETTFHAVCGGVGSEVTEVWPKSHPAPYLVGYWDGPGPALDLSSEQEFRRFLESPPASYCRRSSRFRWTERYTLAQLDKTFKQSLPEFGTLKDVRIVERSRSGRILAMDIVGTTATHRVGKDAVRWLWSGGKVGLGGLQSSLFTIDREKDVFIFRGAGWGHGVGLCQEGARGLALEGRGWRDIVQHYYPGVELEKLKW